MTLESFRIPHYQRKSHLYHQRDPRTLTRLYTSHIGVSRCHHPDPQVIFLSVACVYCSHLPVYIMSVSRFNRFPNEIYYLLGEHVGAMQVETLSALMLVSKAFYMIFVGLLYKNVDQRCFTTLGLTATDRLPLTDAHPASYVRSLSMSGLRGDMMFSARVAMENLSRHCSQPRRGIKVFRFSFSGTSLCDVFGDLVSKVLGQIEDLSIRSAFTTERSLTSYVRQYLVQNVFWLKTHRLHCLATLWWIWSLIFTYGMAHVSQDC